MPPVLLDTDILSELIKGQNPAVQQHAFYRAKGNARWTYTVLLFLSIEA